MKPWIIASVCILGSGALVSAAHLGGSQAFDTSWRYQPHQTADVKLAHRMLSAGFWEDEGTAHNDLVARVRHDGIEPTPLMATSGSVADTSTVSLSAWGIGSTDCLSYEVEWQKYIGGVSSVRRATFHARYRQYVARLSVCIDGIWSHLTPDSDPSFFDGTHASGATSGTAKVEDDLQNNDTMPGQGVDLSTWTASADLGETPCASFEIQVQVNYDASWVGANGTPDGSDAFVWHSVGGVTQPDQTLAGAAYFDSQTFLVITTGG